VYDDPANCIINTVASALRMFFAPQSEQPPLGGGTEQVRLFAGDALPIEAWDFFRDGNEGCNEPFVWVRLMRRYRSKDFPAPFVGGDPCPIPVVIAVEIGVARCAATSIGDCDWECYETEAEISADDSWRIERALCYAATTVRKSDPPCSPMVGLDAILPYGPEGGVIAWTGIMYASLG
jgi:hypothetical protein